MAVILILGDTHIPRRASRIPEQIEEFLAGKKFDFVLCTGDLTDKSVLEYLRKLGKEIVVVRGNMDHLPLPEYGEISVGGIKIGVVHGDQVFPRGNREQLEEIGLEKGVDVFVSGHTHSPDLYKGKVILLNPGSATGAWGGGGGSMKPSFMVAEVGEELIVELYELEAGRLRKTSATFRI